MSYPRLTPIHVVIGLLVLLVGSSFHGQAIPPDDSTATNPVRQCSPKGHWQCVKLTAEEVFFDGVRGKWSRHWWRMSYIGRACKHEKSKAAGHIIEGIFAVPHYIGVGIMNITGFIEHLALQPMMKNKQPQEQRPENDSLPATSKQKGKSP
jgi:hypothetical protein